ncbi:uncharacterized protein BDZ99DRAFT_478905 [Mytilinidion resinicola]|uniref:Uncharacterized protein n=1 Tax=Mytilinidion resinicola TaxID=574789 RepID=A0A6A6YF55_9PEZI|nr:uncharacterized protein BDZ99DRAFT_478905 [Mytilinidion resinicola]KAF2807421.1 hypothetical protein BDZ99DRAFT_478905 [Mytilinidion resinicola]
MSITAAAAAASAALPPLPTAPSPYLCIGDETYPTTCSIRQSLIANGSCASYNQLQYCCNGGIIKPCGRSSSPTRRTYLEGQQEIPLAEAINGDSDGWRESVVTSWTDTYGLEVEPVCIWMAKSVEGGSASLPLSGKGCTKAVLSTTMSSDIFTTSELSGTSSTAPGGRVISASASYSSTVSITGSSFVVASRSQLQSPSLTSTSGGDRSIVPVWFIACLFMSHSLLN